MTPDLCFLFITIMRVKQKTLRADLLKILTEAVETPSAEDLSTVLSQPTLDGPMPVLDTINQRLRSEADAASLKAIQPRENFPPQRDPPPRDNRPRNQSSNRVAQAAPTPAGHEQAHLAEAPAGVNVLGPGTVVGQNYVRPKDKMWYSYLDKGKPVYTTYTATSEVCNICYPDGCSPGQRADSKSRHRPHCYGGKCGKCNLYGHSICFSTKSSSGTLSALKAAADAEDT